MRALGLVLPLLDEVEVCEGQTRRLHAALSAVDAPFRLVLVDNGSRDGTDAVVDRLALDLPEVMAVHLPENAGYGGGIRAGIARLDTDLVGWHWGDGQVEPEVVVDAWRRLDEEALDLVSAHRQQREDGWARVLQTRAYHVAARVLLDLGIPDLNGCPKIFTREALVSLDPRSTNWLLDLEVHVKARDRGLRLGRVPAVMRHRIGGASKVRWSTAWEFALAIQAIRRGHPPWETR